MDYALLVGINAYPDPSNVLDGCLNDVSDVSGLLRGSYGFASSSIAALLDQAATAAAIQTAIQDTVATLRDGDRFLFWYSGHGDQMLYGDINSDVICPVDYDGTPAHAVSIIQFHNMFGRIPAGVRAYWGSDSCFSGNLQRKFQLTTRRTRHFKRERPQTPPVFKRSMTLQAAADALPNIVLLAACRGDQESSEWASSGGRSNGAFTHFLLDVLEQSGGTGLAVSALISKTQAELTANNLDQAPQCTGSANALASPFLGD